MAKGRKVLKDICILKDISLKDIRLPCTWHDPNIHPFQPKNGFRGCIFKASLYIKVEPVAVTLTRVCFVFEILDFYKFLSSDKKNKNFRQKKLLVPTKKTPGSDKKNFEIRQKKLWVPTKKTLSSDKKNYSKNFPTKKQNFPTKTTSKKNPTKKLAPKFQLLNFCFKGRLSSIFSFDESLFPFGVRKTLFSESTLRAARSENFVQAEYNRLCERAARSTTWKSFNVFRRRHTGTWQWPQRGWN